MQQPSLANEQHNTSISPSIDVEATLSDRDVNWVSLPPVLQRLRRPAHELYKMPSKIADKTVRLCLDCFERFFDEEERNDQIAVAQKEATRSSYPPPRPSRHSAQIFPNFCERKSDRRRDMVFNELQADLRMNDQRLRAKQLWRKKFATSHETTSDIDWNTLPASATVLKEMKRYASASKDRSNRKAITAPHPPPASGNNGGMAPDWGPLPTMTAPNGDLIPMTPEGQQLIHDYASPEREHTDADLFDALDIEKADFGSYFELSFPQRLMFELWKGMTSTCRYSRECHSKGEDVPTSDPLFVVYRKNKLRFEDPPVVKVMSDREIAELEATHDILSEDVEYAAHRNRLREMAETALFPQTGDKEEQLSVEEKRYLYEIIAKQKDEADMAMSQLGLQLEGMGMNGAEEEEDEEIDDDDFTEGSEDDY